MLRFVKFFFVTSLSFAIETARIATHPEVQTTIGTLRGYTQMVEGVEVQTFTGIPFALPPVGPNRFKAPVPSPVFNDTIDATELHLACPQLLYNYFPGNQGEAMWNPATGMSEDCLYLNVWVPVSSTGRRPGNLTTMVWIFGGGFVSGSASLDLYDGKYLAATSGVIVVSINYRLGPFGFLYLRNENAPGNMGLLDQQLALRWIHDNIFSFGGDADKVCLFGESAGAASIHYHMISEESKGYFQKAILQSGSALAPWAYRSPPEAYKLSRDLAENVGCSHAEAEDIVSCLRDINTDTLTTSQWSLTLDWTFSTFPFVPTLDGTFLTEEPAKATFDDRFEKKPMLIGVDKNEETYWIIYGLLGQINHESGDMDRDMFVSSIPQSVNPAISDAELAAIVHEYDTMLSPDSRLWMPILDDIGGDYNFKCPTLNLAKAVASSDGPSVYVFSYEHRASTNPWPEWTGVLHGDEIEFVFGQPLKTESNFTEEEERFSRDIMQMWANFAKTGDPNLESTQGTSESSRQKRTVEEAMDLNQDANKPPTEVLYNNEHLVNDVFVEQLHTNTLSDVLRHGMETDDSGHHLNFKTGNDKTQKVMARSSRVEIYENGGATSSTASELPSTSTRISQTSGDCLNCRRTPQITSSDVDPDEDISLDNSVWPRYLPSSEDYVVLDRVDGKSLHHKTRLRHRQCKFWQNVYPLLENMSRELRKCQASRSNNPRQFQ